MARVLPPVQSKAGDMMISAHFRQIETNGRRRQ